MPGPKRIAFGIVNGATILLKYFLRVMNYILLMIIFASSKIAKTNASFHYMALVAVFMWLVPIICKHIGRNFQIVDTNEVGGDLEKVCRKADAVGLKFSKIRCEYMRIVQQMQRQLYQLGLNPEEAEADISTLMRLKRFTFGKACSAETSKCPLVNPEPSFDCPKQLRPQPSNECQRQSKTQQSSGRYFW